MKKTIKLKKNYEFNGVFKKGKYSRGKFLECFYRKKSNEKSINSIGIAISTKVCKAVKRNLIKRRILSAYTKIEEDLKTGYEIVILWKKNVEIKNSSFENILEDMTNIFKNIGLFDEKFNDSTN